jgi:N-carbamoyl-L-amino-acid hydrolase
MLAALGTWIFDPPSLWAQDLSELRIDGPRLLKWLEELSQFGKTPEGGVNRVAYSAADAEARKYVIEIMREASLEPSVDYAGNIIGRRPGRQANLPPLSLGSHIDSVPHGGNYDGPLGSLGAIEVAQTLVENDITTHHPIEIVVFQNEEGGKTGSRALIGKVTEKDLDRVTHSGKTIRDGITYIGGDPTKLREVERKPGDISAFLELHIEQGAILDNEQIQIGVVEGIVGIRRWNVVINGVANHAGTTPMLDRHDALLAGARFVEAVHRVVTDMPGRQVGTVGQIEAFPGAPNVVPGKVTTSLEIRDLDMDKIDSIFEKIEAGALEIGRDTGTQFQFDPFYISEGAPTDERLRQWVAESSGALGLTSIRMPSGAGHDAQSMAMLGPVGMIFIPSVDGFSHSPKEFSHPEDIVNGVNVLLHTLLKADSTL